MTDTDPPGLAAREIITKKCARIFNVHHIDLPKNDIADMSVQEVQQFLLPKIKEIDEKGI